MLEIRKKYLKYIGLSVIVGAILIASCIGFFGWRSKENKDKKNYNDVSIVNIDGFGEYEFDGVLELSSLEINKPGYRLIGFVDEKGDEVLSFENNDKREYFNIKPVFEMVDYSIEYINQGILEEFNKATNNNITSFNIDMVKSAPIVLDSLENFGYNFVGFFVDDKKISSITEDMMKDLSITIKWEPIRYSISYSQEGILEKFENIQGNKISSYTIEDEINFGELTNAGYEFKGLYENNQLLNKIDKGRTGDIQLTSKWTPKEYSISYTSDGIMERFEEDQTSNFVTKYTIEDELELNDLTNRGYEFKGYYKAGNKITSIKEMFGDLELTTKWTPIKYTISYQNKYAAVTSNNNPEIYSIEDSIQLCGLQLTNYKFVNWQTESGQDIETINQGQIGNVVLKAAWSMVGEGTQESPYLIYNEDQLKTLFFDMNAIYELQNDIKISYTWSPIGSEDNEFNGVFDGNGFTLTIDKIEDNINSFAMFGCVGESGKVCDLIVSSTKGAWAEDFKCSIFAGIALYNYGVIEDCTNKIDIHTYITNSGDSERYSLSGICYYNYGDITRCSNLGTLKVTASNTALIAGIACCNASNSGIITDCYSNENMVATASSLVYIGKYVLYMKDGAILRVSNAEWNLDNYTKLDFIKGSVTTTQIGTSPVIIKEVVQNDNYLSNKTTPYEDGYIYYRIIEWDTPLVDFNNTKYLEGWFKKTAEGISGLNTNGEWELLSSTNGYGLKYTKDKGGYFYAYDENHNRV